MLPNEIIYTCYSEQITSRISSSDALNQRTQIPDLKKLTQG